MAELPLYDPQRACCKCGFDRTTDRYRDWEFTFAGCRAIMTNAERILRECLRCGYQWAERPLVATEPFRREDLPA